MQTPWGSLAGGSVPTLAAVEAETDMFDVLEVAIEDPVQVGAIRVETVESPSWVAWREIEILYGG